VRFIPASPYLAVPNILSQNKNLATQYNSKFHGNIEYNPLTSKPFCAPTATKAAIEWRVL